VSELTDRWGELLGLTRSYLAVLRDGGYAFADGKFEAVVHKRPPVPAVPPARKEQAPPSPKPGRAAPLQLPRDALADPYAHLSAPKSSRTMAAPGRSAGRPSSPPAAAAGLLEDAMEAQRLVAATKGLDELRALVARCRLCGLGAGRTHPVFGEGNPNADLVFVGEAPGYHEDIQGRPFVGRAGALLTKMIEKMGMRREDVYICNILKSRPPNNRDPQPEEIKACEPFLQRQLDLIRPKVICALGRIAIQGLLRDTTPIGRLRGKWRTYHGIPLMPTFHPAYLLRSPEKRHETWEDLQAIMAKLEELKRGQ